MLNYRMGVFALMVSLPFAAFAQEFRATLLGTVTDPSGSPVPNALVRATQVDTNQTTEVKTTTLGLYTIPFLNPGVYNLEVTASGFKGFKISEITLRTADKRELPVTLQVGEMSQEVTVSAEVDTVETATASRGLNFDPLKTQSYPLNGRQTYMLMALTPGVIFTQEQFGAQGFSGTRGWDVNNSYKINGGRTGSSQFLLNGAPISDKDGNWQIAPNVEAVQEFKVMTNTYDAQYGRFTGGIVNTTVKAGTNDWHGSAFEFFRNSVLDANTTQNNEAGADRGKHNQHQFGGVVGGPLRKDKDFVFFSFEGWREVVPFNKISDTVPMDLRDGQHFSEYGFKIYDPMTTAPCTGGPDVCKGSTYIRQPFPNNVIPQSRISPIGAKILSYYPTPNGPDPNALSQNYFATANTGRYEYNQPMGRWDHVLGENDRIYGLFTYWHGTEFRNQSGFPPPAEYGDIFSARTNQNYIADWTHVMGPTMVFDLRASFGRFTSRFPRTRAFDFGPKDLGMNNMIHAPSVTYALAPRIELDNFSQVFDNSIDWNTYNQYDILPSLTWTRNKHSFHFGFEFNYTAKGNGGTGLANGTFKFDRGWTQQLSNYSQGSFDGSQVASLLLGAPASGSIEYNDTFYRTRPYYAVYVQDDWKVSPRITLNLGLRYDVQIPWLERYNRLNGGFDATTKNPYSDQVVANWNQVKAQYDAANPGVKYPYPAAPAALYGGLLFPGVGGQPSRPYDTDWTGIAPRAGIAWQIGPRTVLRAGGGMFYQPQTQENTTSGFSQTTNYATSLDGITPATGIRSSGPYTLENPFPTGLLPIGGSSLGLSTNVGNGIGFDSRKVPMPRSYQYSFGFEHQLPWAMVAELSYTGNITVKNTYGYQMGNVPYDQFLRAQQDPSYLDRQIPNPYYGVLPETSDFGRSPSISAYQLYRNFPLFNGIQSYTLPKGRYRYDALQFKLEKRVLSSAKTGLLTFVLSYSFSKSYEENHRLNDWNMNEPLIHEVDYQDKPQNIAFSGVWDLPIGTGRQWVNARSPVAKALANDWRFTWIYTYYSGYPVGWPDLVNACGTWDAPAGGNPFDHWFNNDKSCYSQRAPYTLRTAPDRFGNIRNPAEPQLNLSVEKTLRFGERYAMILRGESFNVTNTPIYPGPNTDFNSPQFGMVPHQQQNFPRLVQLAAKFTF